MTRELLFSMRKVTACPQVRATFERLTYRPEGPLGAGGHTRTACPRVRATLILIVVFSCHIFCHQKLSSKIVIKNCHKCLKGQKSLGSLCSVVNSLIVTGAQPTKQGTRSPIELFWTAKNGNFWTSWV